MSGDSQAFAGLALVVAFLVPLVVAAWFVEWLAPRARKDWRRHVRRMAKYRAAERAAEQDKYDAERKRAAAWLASNCYWKQEK